MSKKERGKPPEASRSRYKQSIVYKLGMKLFFRLFGIFLLLDIVICLLAAVSAVMYSERAAASVVKSVFIYGTPDMNSMYSLGSGIEIKEYQGQYKLYRIPRLFQNLYPESTARGARGFKPPEAEDISFSEFLRNIKYGIIIEQNGAKYEITVPLGQLADIFTFAFRILLIIQLIIIIDRAFKDIRMVRRTLSPIYELTTATQILNRAGSQFDPAKMEALAGKLEGIDAARLDTRIPVSDTQDELKSLAKAINDMLDRINESYRAQVRFVSDASHELRTPISVIQGYANLLDRWGKKDEKILQESITAIRDEAANMKELVEQLLFLARGDNNTITLQIENFNLCDLAREVVHETEMIDSSHSYEAHLSEISVSADRALIKQALRILVDNAIKYTPSGGRITVAVKKDGGSAMLSVQDDGIGISPESVPKIFDRFYRADESRTRATGGAGLGLSIAKWIAQRHCGHMDVLSREGIGTRITLVLPAAETALAAQPNAGASEKHQNLGEI